MFLKIEYVSTFLKVKVDIPKRLDCFFPLSEMRRKVNCQD